MRVQNMVYPQKPFAEIAQKSPRCTRSLEHVRACLNTRLSRLVRRVARCRPLTIRRHLYPSIDPFARFASSIVVTVRSGQQTHYQQSPVANCRSSRGACVEETNYPMRCVLFRRFLHLDGCGQKSVRWVAQFVTRVLFILRDKPIFGHRQPLNRYASFMCDRIKISRRSRHFDDGSLPSVQSMCDRWV